VPVVNGKARPISVAAVAWLEPRELSGLAMPVAHRKIAQRLLEP
jgi:hypothetical protein